MDGVPPTPRRSSPLAVLSTVALLAVVVAVPVVLATVGGSPVPHGGWASLDRLFRRGQGFDLHVATGWVLHGALVLAWVTWAWMVVCVGIELVARSRGRAPTRLPGSRTMQAAAACLVGTSLALVTVGRTLPAPTVRSVPMAGAPTPETFASFRVLAEYPPEDHLDHRSAPGRRSEPSDGTAARRLVAVPDPHVDPSGDSEVGIASVPSAGPDPLDSRPVAAVHTVSGRQTLWSIAEERLGSARRWREIADLNYSVRQPDGGALGDDHWVASGWKLLLPPDALHHVAPRQASPDHGSGPVATTTHMELAVDIVADPVETAPVAVAATSDGHLVRHGSGPRVPLVPIGSGLAGAGVVALLDRLRRIQQRHRGEGELIALPGPEAAATERRLRSGGGAVAGPDMARALDVALDRFVRSFEDGGIRVPTIVGVEVHDGQVELHLQTAPDWSQGSGGGSVLEPVLVSLGGDDGDTGDTRPVGARALRPVPPCPTLVAVGRTAVGPLLVNLEVLGSLALVGPVAPCEDVVRALALELATSPWAGRFDLVLVGFGIELGRFERVEVVDQVAGLVDRLHRRRLFGVGPLGSTDRFPVSPESRRQDRSPDPLLVVCGPLVEPAVAAEVVAAGSDPASGTMVVVCGEGIRTDHRLVVSAGRGSSLLEPLGSVVFPVEITADDLGEVCALVDTAFDLQSVTPAVAPYDSLSIPLPPAVVEAVETPGAFGTPGVAMAPGPPTVMGPATVMGEEPPANRSDPRPDIRVCVLGPVAVEGAARPFTRAWAKELVVYLAMHPHGATNEAWATALWPDRVMASSSLHSTASVARRALGSDRYGRDHLPRAHGRLALGDHVGTDWAELVALAGTDDPATMRRGLELVRGRLFDGLRAADWPILEGVAPAMEAAVVDLAGRLAGSCLRRGDPAGAEWAARRGLLVSPYDERLYRMLLRAADLAGNPAGVEAVMAELVRLVADGVEPFDSVHPSTMDLYRSLTRRKALATSLR